MSNFLKILGVGWGAKEGIEKAGERVLMKWTHVECVHTPTVIRLHTLHICGLLSVTCTSLRL